MQRSRLHPYKLTPKLLARIAPPISGYNCNNHCYVEIDWYGAVLGSAVTINEGFITCGTCDGFIDNEMWLADIQSRICTSVQGGACWVEAGYSTYAATETNPAKSCITNSAANCYFWADNRPGTGGYTEHVIANVPSSDYGNLTSYTITQDSSSTSSWNVQILTASGNYYAGPSLQSTANQMSPNDIAIGQELAGTNGAGANRTDFLDSEWADTNGNGFHYQTSSGQQTTNAPLSGHWVSPPNGSNNGGDFCTAC